MTVPVFSRLRACRESDNYLAPDGAFRTTSHPVLLPPDPGIRGTVLAQRWFSLIEVFMRKLLLMLLVSAIAVSLYVYVQGKRIERKTDAKLAGTSAVLPVDQGKFIKAVTKAFGENKPQPSNKFSRFSLAQPGQEQFPGEYQLTYYGSEESIARYRSIALERRRLDFYLYDFSDEDNHGSYWESEYYRGQERLPFRCNFIIHHEPEGSTATRVEVFELAPRVWAGKRLAFGRHGPGYIVDIRNVAPTTSDRVEVLDLIKKATQP